MKAGIYQGVGAVEVVDVPKPIPGPKDVVIKVANCGICGSDLYEYNVEDTFIIQPGSRFGHEYSGTIAEVGSEVTGIREGMRVTVVPLTATRRGMMGAAMIGGYSQYTVVEDAALGYNIFELPEELSFEDGALVEPFATCMNGVKQVSPQPKDRALVVGAGPIGLGALASLKTLGVENIVVSDLSELRLQKAIELGASAVHNPRKIPLVDFLEEYYSVKNNPYVGMVDVVIDASGASSVPGTVLNIVSAGGRIVFLATPHDDITINLGLIMGKCLTIKGSIGYGDEFNQVIQAVARGETSLKPIITHRFPVNELDAAFKTASKVDEAVKVMIEMPISG